MWRCGRVHCDELVRGFLTGPPLFSCWGWSILYRLGPTSWKPCAPSILNSFWLWCFMLVCTRRRKKKSREDHHHIYMPVWSTLDWNCALNGSKSWQTWLTLISRAVFIFMLSGCAWTSQKKLYEFYFLTPIVSDFLHNSDAWFGRKRNYLQWWNQEIFMTSGDVHATYTYLVFLPCIKQRFHLFSKNNTCLSFRFIK